MMELVLFLLYLTAVGFYGGVSVYFWFFFVPLLEKEKEEP